ncbi:MAG: hypothetical protein QM691_14630 [Opitutaceae bacterium]
MTTPESSAEPQPPRVPLGWWLWGWFLLILGMHLWAITRGWTNQNLPGHEFRQAQTALAASFIQKEHNFALDYPTPVLGKPWSVPFEFPLYQWTVVAVADTTKLPLVTAARWVSAACFYLGLPAIWLLLGQLGVERTRRWLVLGFVLLCPVHVFYARAFLIETMALLFALWFLAAFGRALQGRSVAWGVVANVAGVGAGLVKVTTFAAVLLPAAAWALVLATREHRRQAEARWRGVLGICGRALGLVALPLAASVAWIRFADAVKAQNPAAQFALSANLRDFNLGTWAERCDPTLWLGQGENILHGVAGPVVLVAGAVALLLARGRRALPLGAAAAFVAPLLVFPVLYKVHDYYYVANATFLAAALALAVGALLERARWRRGGVALLVALPLLQVRSYWNSYAETQAKPLPPGSHLSQILRTITDENDVLIVSGYDWSAVVPYQAQRRALMFHGGGMNDPSLVDRSYAALAGERIGAVIVNGAQRTNRAFIEATTARFALEPRPLFGLDEDDVYVPAGVWPTALELVRTMPIAALRLPTATAAGGESPKGRMVDVAELPPLIRRNFRGFSPEPRRSEATFDYSCAEEGGEVFFSMHPRTRLWFTPPARRCRLETSYLIYPGAYEGKEPGTGTDGVQFTVAEQRPDGSRRVLFERLLDPARHATDRGRQSLVLEFELEEGAELLLETTDGPNGNWAFDWAALGPFTLRAVAP